MATLASSDHVDQRAARVRYSTGAIVLHWLIALTLAFQIALGFAMPHAGPYSFAPMQLHKSVGITILLLTLARLAWRATHRRPPAVEGGWEGALANVVHWAFYAVLLVGPLTGWIIVSTAKLQVPTMFWGTIPWPHLPLPQSLGEPMEGIHEALSWVAIGLFLLHVLGALRHQFLLKDPVIGRMAPGGSVGVAMGLLVATVALYFGAGMYIAGKYLVPAMAHGYSEEHHDDADEAGNAQATAAPAAAAVAPEAAPTAEVSPTPTPTDTAEAAAGPPPVWSITGGKRLAFSVDNGGSPLNGTFRDWSGSITMDPDHPETAKLAISIKLASASLGDGTQDAMLQGAEFFASGANPTATWRSSKVTQASPGHYRASGTLSLKGHSRPQSISFALTGKDLKRHVTGSATIDRTAFDVGTGDAAASLGKSVTLNFAFDAAGKAP
jgi:cytochrome b561/polyisoprenoid-binding protein YceI